MRWAESVQYMHAQGVSQIWEIGSGKVLTGLARRIERDLSGAAVGKPEEVAKVLEAAG